MGATSSTIRTIQANLTADFDPNSLLLDSPQQPVSVLRASDSGVSCSSDHFVDPNQRYVYSQSSSSANVNEGTGMQHHSNRDLTWPMAITNAKQDPQQRQHMQFSRSWCAGYTDGPSESGNLILTSPGTQSNVQQWNQADQTSENSTSLAIRWSSGQNSESRESSPLKYNGVSSALERSGPTKILRQHENLMRSLPHSSSMNRQSNRMTNFGQQEDRIQENWGARLERNSNSNYSAQTHCGVEKVFGEEEVWDESYNKFEQPF